MNQSRSLWRPGEIDKAIKPRVWRVPAAIWSSTRLSAGIDRRQTANRGRGATRLETRSRVLTWRPVEEMARQIRLRDPGRHHRARLDDMEERRNRQRVMTTLQDALRYDKSPTSSFLQRLWFGNYDAETRQAVAGRTLCTPCLYCQGAGLVKSPQRSVTRFSNRRKPGAGRRSGKRQAMLRINPE